MDIQNLKRWHWMCIGLIVGLLYGAINLWTGPSFVTEDTETLTQGEFEWAASGRMFQSPQQLLSIGHSVEPRLSSTAHVVVHAFLPGDPPGRLWVTGMMQRFGTNRSASTGNVSRSNDRVEEWKPFRYETKSPYIAFTGAPGKYPSVVEYLNALSRQDNLKFSYAYAWWEGPAWMVTIPTAIGFLAIGVIWPLIIDLLNGAGWGLKLKEKSMQLSSGKRAVGQRAGVVQFSLESDDEWATDQTITAETSATTELTEAPAIPVLPGSSSVSVADLPDRLEPNIEYEGEFYPVAKTKMPDEG